MKDNQEGSFLELTPHPWSYSEHQCPICRKIFDSFQRIQKTKERLAYPKKFCLEELKEIDEKIWKLRVDTLGEELAKVKSVENAKRSPVEDY